MSEARDNLTRRSFLSASAASLGAALPAPGGAEQIQMPWSGPAVVRRVFLARHAGWPRPDVDLKAEVAKIEANLLEWQKRYPGRIQLTGGEMLRNEAAAEAWAAQATQADIILAFNLTTGVYSMLRKLVASDLPVVLFSLPYMGHDWTHAAAFQQMGNKVEVIASSSFAALDPYVKLFQTVHHLRHSKVLLVARPDHKPETSGYARRFGTQFAFPAYTDIQAAYQAADASAAASAAREFEKAALRVVEPKPEEISASLRLYHAIQNLMRTEGANAIAIDCLGGFSRKELPAYPCVAFSKLNDAGLYGVCECDLESTMTQLLITSFSGVPGFVNDPVFDTSRNELIFAHCVAATRLRALNGKPSPYLVRSHLEDHKGVSMQVLAPAAGTVTIARFAGADRLLLATGEVIGNVDNPNGCRTKIRARVSNARRYLEGYSAALTRGGKMPGTRDLLHRVVFYGNHVRAVRRLGRLLGFEILQEG